MEGLERTFTPARLRSERERLGYKLNEFAEMMGITRQTQAKYEKLTRSPDSDYLEKASEHGIDVFYLITGTRLTSQPGISALLNSGKTIDEIVSELLPLLAEPGSDSATDEFSVQLESSKEKSGSYRKSDQKLGNGSDDPIHDSQIGSEQDESSRMYEEAFDSDSFVKIPLYNVHAAAGAGKLIHTEEITATMVFKKEWIHNELHANPANLYLIHIEGDSMEPSLRPGDVVLVDRTHIAPKRDGIYVIRMGDSLLVKRLQRLPNHRLKVTSDNPAYEPFEISLDFDLDNEFEVIGRVIWSGRRQ